ncbi:calcitonin gene-related peptide type 1 receptor-like [Procambarus clarkii]|uniref:calcitonin gene-related peptide type 1 receptor-like n=1 Tax=Procambarus clarkii TaxID=6728 RepID=UPI003742AB69
MCWLPRALKKTILNTSYPKHFSKLIGIMRQRHRDKVSKEKRIDEQINESGCQYNMVVSCNCPNTWDGWQCWPATPPNTQLRRSCPSYIYHGKGPSCAKEASKLCESEGRWYRRGEIHEWSNYSSCSVEENIHRRLYVHIAAYSISVASLFPALCIFFSYKQLRVHRITLHKHLFISLLLEAVGVIVFRFLQLYKNDLIQQNPAWCVALNLLTKYASLSNYMWYLCEGFYLHKLLASAFAEQNSLIIFYLIGWGFPLVPLTIYAVIRGQGEGNTHCWIVPVEGLDWVINLPPLLAILINVIFVVNIIRILVSKVRATSANEPSQYRKAVRATMMVVPLFGLQYIITIYRHQVLGCDWQDLYQIFNNLIEGSTGAVVAIIFCYTNGEVKALLRRSWERLQERRAPHGVRGHEALRSRSLSTVQTTLIDPSPARRNSSIVSICANNNPFRRSNSGANASQMLSLRGSRTSITQASQADSGSAPPAAVSRRSPKTIGSKLGPGGAERFGPSRSPVHILDSSPASRSPSLLEEVEDEVKCAEAGDPTLPAGGRRAGVERHCPVVLFKKNDVEPCVNINVNGLRTSVDQGYESCHNTGVLDE